MRQVVCPDCGEKCIKHGVLKSGSQRCLFHAFCQVKRYTTGNLKTLAGRDLYIIAKSLFDVTTMEHVIYRY